MNTQVKEAEARPDHEVEEKVDVAAVDRTVVAKAYPNSRGLDRRIAYLFDHGKSRFFRVNYQNPDNQNYIVRSCFVEVTGGAVKEWPNPAPKPGGFDYSLIGG